MVGLLYKDFVSVKGKWIISMLLGLTLLFLILRINLPGSTQINATNILTKEAVSNTGDLYDMILAQFPLLFLFSSMLLIPFLMLQSLTNDEKNRTRCYISSWPISQNHYIASKYFFIAILAYFLLSMNAIWNIIFLAYAGKSRISDFISMLFSFSIGFMGISILICAIELPFSLTLGIQKANLIRRSLLMILLFVAFSFFLFGDIDAFDKNFNIFVWLKWVQAHEMISVLLQILTPVIALLLFWLSYKLTCVLNRNREVNLDA